MRTPPVCLALALLVVELPFPVFAGAPRALIATPTHVSDGDSVAVTTEDHTTLRVRLFGIDAPEVAHGTKPGQPFGREARDYLDHLIGGKTVRVDAFGHDRHNCVLAVIWDGPVNVNLLMVAMGYAEVYRGAPCQAYCRELERAEAKARRERVGAWAQGVSYESPASFRKRLRVRGD